MIAHSQPKKASASNKDGKDSDPKTRRGQTHISAYNPSLPPSDRQHKEPKSCTGRFRASTTMSLSLILDPAPTVWSSPCDQRTNCLDLRRYEILRELGRAHVRTPVR